jgi:HAD superfamily hydrolase (TIGR01509 family)
MSAATLPDEHAPVDMSKTLIAFDLIGVLAEPSWREVAAAPDLPAWRRLKLGEIDEREFWDDASAAAFRRCLRLRADRLALLARLRAAGHPIAIASNFAAAWLPTVRALLPDPAAIDLWCVSGELGIAKPDPRFWSRLRAFNPDVLLVDDQRENLASARAAGLRTVWALPGADLPARLLAALQPAASDG